MRRYLFVESRDPFETTEGQKWLQTIRQAKTEGMEVSVYLTQNGVLPARRRAVFDGGLKTLAADGVKIYADSFSLRQRAINEVADGIEVTGMVDRKSKR